MWRPMAIKDTILDFESANRTDMAPVWQNSTWLLSLFATACRQAHFADSRVLVFAIIKTLLAQYSLWSASNSTQRLPRQKRFGTTFRSYVRQHHAAKSTWTQRLRAVRPGTIITKYIQCAVTEMWESMIRHRLSLVPIKLTSNDRVQHDFLHSLLQYVLLCIHPPESRILVLLWTISKVYFTFHCKECLSKNSSI